MRYDWKTWAPHEFEGWYVVALEKVEPDHCISTQFVHGGRDMCTFVGAPTPEHKKRDWEKELEAQGFVTDLPIKSDSGSIFHWWALA